jgi:glycine/D-amino acid oxidase-like deaminating enzyme
MRIAIIGAGLAGLSVAWHLLQMSAQVTLFDPLGVGGGTSGTVSAPLLHPFPGRLALSSWRSAEGMAATLELIAVAEKQLGRAIADRSGVLRLALTPQQKEDFLLRAKKDPRAEWWEADQVQKIAPLAIKAPALWIPSGMAIFSHLYLQGLWQACAARGAQLIKEVASGLDSYDAVVFATGAQLIDRLPLKLVQGHILLCRGEVPLTIASHGHISTTDRPGVVQLGATYEPPTAAIVPEKAAELREKMSIFYPLAKEWEEVELRVGVRAAPQIGYRPIIAKLASNQWALAGLGSRGLLYHALLGRDLAEQIMFGAEGASEAALSLDRSGNVY